MSFHTDEIKLVSMVCHFVASVSPTVFKLQDWVSFP